LAQGCNEICLADTIGVATSSSVEMMLEAVLASVAVDKLSLHFHDTSGGALENVAVALKRGIRIFDSAAGGLGGCPFAPGAPGNLATEKLIQYLDHVGLDAGVDLDGIAAASRMVAPMMSRQLAV
jgi:isopropylmalate/homocitrate/citramalate synthase